MSNTTKRIREELDRIASENGGILMPAAVVDAARPASSPLHSKFEWDDSAAAEQYRLQQARQLIRITVNVIGGRTDEEKLWVSLTPDRAKGGGYRGIVSVMSDSNLRNQLLEDALADAENFQQKYRHLSELSDVFAAMKKLPRRRQVA